MSGSQGQPKRVRKEGRKQYSIPLGENREAMETKAYFQELEEWIKKLNIKNLKSRWQIMKYILVGGRM